MNQATRAPLLALALPFALGLGACAELRGERDANDMTFFVTSAGPGNGADLGGLAGADRHCQQLAAAVEAGRWPSEVRPFTTNRRHALVKVI